MIPPEDQYHLGEWIASYPAEIIICDQDGTILEMNQVAADIYAREGSMQMIGRNVFDHHPEPAGSQLMSVIQKKQHVLYTTEKAGVKKLVSIAPWYREGTYAGFTLLVLDLPENLPNILKDS